MTAREEAVERVRAYVDDLADMSDGWTIDLTGIEARLTLGDLRLLLSGGEGGRHLAKDALPRGETHPDTPSQPSAPEFSTDIGWRLLDKGVGEDWEALGLFPKSPPFHLTIYDGRQNDMTVGPLSAREADNLGHALIAIAALTDPRQPSEVAFDIDAFIAGYVMAVEKRHKGPWEGIYDYAALVGQEWHQEGRKPVETTGMIMVADMEAASLLNPQPQPKD